MDYALEGLSSGSFEQLVQAILMAELGPDVVVYGDGPDGGRDATYEGPMHGLGEGRWAGSLLMQAKFLQRPKGAGADGAWALRLLREELNGYYERGFAPGNPDYFLFATNAVLTPVADTGSKDKARAMLDGAVTSGLFRDYDIWDRDKICRFIDGNADLRNAYGAWITPGDVLATMTEQLGIAVPDFDRTLSLFLQKELLADKDAKLEQAGRPPEDRISIARVFVDLPLERSAPVDGDLEETLVKQLLRVAHQKLQPGSGPGETDRASSPAADGRWVVVGGPGQGKTTVGQFVCQLFRAAILLTRPPDTIAFEAQQVLDAIVSSCSELSIRWPTVRRFPLHLALKDYAAALDKQSELSLLEFVAGRIEKRVARDVPIDVLRSWLADYPWVIVLDGLDEVPASSNRDAVLSAIDDFWVDVAEARTDAMVVATTRPQGYSGDFAPEVYRHCKLAPLSVPDALGYARRLVSARYRADTDRQGRIIDRLKLGAGNEATAHLMRSPLQVTIMATLVDQVGRPPEQRWKLFSQYYEVIYNREVERDIPAAWVLRQHKPNVDSIHHRVALALQLESEGDDVAARMSRDDLAKIVEDRLEEEEHDGPELVALRDAILEAAAERLVFVVGVEEDRVGFEVRSLQEFMAAEALMDGRDEVVSGRLRAIARASSWRNVMLFAAGRCFGHSQHLRDTIHTVCVELNDSDDDPLGRVARDGSVLAMDLLEDGAVRGQPMYQRLLLDQALRVASGPPLGAQRRLAELYDPRDAHQYEAALQEAVRRSPPRSGVWTVLHRLAMRGVDWAERLLMDAWPEPGDAEVDLIKDLNDSNYALRLMPQIARAALHYDSSKLLDGDPLLKSKLEQHKSGRDGGIWQRLSAVARDVRLHGGALTVRVPNSRVTLTFTTMRLRRAFRTGAYVEVSRITLPDGLVHPAWRLEAAAVDFRANATRDGLAAAIERVGPIADWEWRLASSVPWPLLACARAAADSEDVRRLAGAARAGRLGDEADWVAAEERWLAHGVTLADVEHLPEDGLPFDAAIGRSGAPLAAATFEIGDVSDDFATLVSWIERLRRRRDRGLVSEVVLTEVARAVRFADGIARGRREPSDVDLPISLEQVEQLAGIAAASGAPERRAVFDIALLGTLRTAGGLDQVGALDAYGRLQPLLTGSADAASQVEPLADLVTDHPDRAGLWRLLAVAVVSTGETVATRLPIEAGRAVAPQAAYILAIALPGESPPAVRDLLTSLAREPAWTEMLAGALTLAIGRGDGRTLLAGLDAAVGQPGNLDEASIATLIGLGLSGRASALLDEDTRTGLELPRISSGRARGASPA